MKSEEMKMGRRGMLAGVLSLAAITGSAIPKYDPIEEGTNMILAAMRRRHGGEWKVLVDHDAGAVAVTRSFSFS